MKRLLILGATGMLGSCLYKYFKKRNYEVHGTVRRKSNFLESSESLYRKNIHILDVKDQDNIFQLIAFVKPTHVINCVGLIKQLNLEDDIEQTIYINSLLPHILKKICAVEDAFLIHFSTDCVFSGIKGFYAESDQADSRDLYGLTKFIGEVLGAGSVTIRTSIIGHEIASKLSLLEWFLNQTGPINGYSKAIFSGFPTIEIARILDEYILTSNNISGLYHLSSEPISKYDLLKLIADTYKKDIDIRISMRPVVDRSLDSRKFRLKTGFMPKPWKEMIYLMHESSVGYDKNS